MEQSRHTRRQRTFRRLCIVALVTLAVTAVPLGLLSYAASAAARRARAESVELLASAAGVDALEEAVGPLGVVIRLQDGAWIAISYRDSHSAANFFSSSVALCSDGTWLESDEHYCGEFGAYRSMRHQAREMSLAGLDSMPFVEALGEQRLTRVEAATHLGDARDRLCEMGFRRSNISRVPGAGLAGP